MFFLLILLPPRSTLFPYTTLFRSHLEFAAVTTDAHLPEENRPAILEIDAERNKSEQRRKAEQRHATADDVERADRKSTRLNSSHTVISYAVFCLKKKKKEHTKGLK